MDADLVEELFLAEDPRPFLKDIRRGLDSLGIFKIAKQLPIIMHLFTREKDRPITYKMVTHLLNAVFSETGSNRKIEENRLYRKFLKYLKEVASLSLLQNGNLPRVMDADLVEELFLAEDPRPFLKDIRRGLDSLGIFKIAKQLPIIMHLFTREKDRPITYKMVTHLLNAVFSETGSNRKIEENRLYRKFLKYLKEVASGRRGDMTLGRVLMFDTGTDVEPPLGFRIHPALHFVDSESPLPTANTCINKLWLSLSGSNTPEAKLFDLYDLGFSNAFYGLQ